MKVTIDLVEHLATLSRISLTEDEKKKFLKDFTAIIGYFDKLNQVNTDGVKIDKRHLNAETELRKDEPEQCLDIEKVVMNAPESKEGAIVVPMVIE